MNFEKRLYTFLAAGLFALASWLPSTAQQPSSSAYPALLTPLPLLVQFGDCTQVTPGTCPAGSTTVAPNPTGTDCFGCPLGTQTSQWRSEPNPPLPANAPRLRLPKYKPNPAFCERVVQVDISASADAQGTLRVENRDTLNRCPNTILTLDVDLTLNLVNGPVFGPVNLNISSSQAVSLSPFDGSIDFMGPSGTIQNFGPFNQSACKRYTGTDVSFFVDTTATTTDDFFEFAHEANDTSGVSGCAPVTFESDPFASLRVDVVYTVCRLTPPVLGNDTRVSTCLNTPRNLNVFANDTSDTPLACPTIGTSTGLSIAPPTAGTVTWVTDAACTNALCNLTCVHYVPTAGFIGSATITYSVSDTDGCPATATALINVRQPPTAADDTTSTCRGTPVNINILSNDTVGAGTIACPGGISLGAVSPAGAGTVVLGAGSCTNAICTGTCAIFTPSAAFTGTATFSYTLTDSFTCSDPATVTINVRTPPTANDDTASTCPGAPVNINILSNDVVGSGTIACLGGIALGAVSPAGAGTVVLGAGGCTNAICNGTCAIFTPTAGFTGAATFSYTLTDSNTCLDPATVTVTVRTPPAANDDTASTCRATPVNINILANDTLGGGTIACPGGVAFGTVSPAGAGTVVLGAGACTNGICTGQCAIFTPSASFTGVATFTYTLTDSNTCTDSAIVSVTVFTPPAANDDTSSTCRATPVNINIFSNDTLGSGTVTCPGGVALGAVSPAGAGTVVLGAGACTNTICNGQCAIFTPSASFTGTATFTYTLTDSNTCTDNATVTINVRTPPTANDDTASTCPGAPVNINFLSNDTAGSGTIACPAGIALGVVSPAGAGTVVLGAGACTNAICTGTCAIFTPAAGFTGTATFSYTLTDSFTCTDPATVTVTVRTPPAANDDTASTCRATPVNINILANDTLGGGTIACPGGVSFGTVSPAGAGTVVLGAGACTNAICTGQCAIFTPSASFTGTATFTYTLTDSNTCTDNATVTVNVRTPPTANDDTSSTCRATPVNINILSNDTIGSGTIACPGGIALGAVSPAGAGTVVLGAGACTNSICTGTCAIFTPSASFTGVATFIYTLTDSNTCTDNATVTINVRTPPTANDDTASTCRATPVNINILANDAVGSGTITCPGGIALGAVSPAGAGTVVLGAGSCTNAICTGTCAIFTPSASFTGVATFSYTLTDSFTCTDNAVVTVTVLTPPVANPDSASTCLNTPVLVNILFNDSSDTALLCPPPTTRIALSAVTPAAAGTATVTSDPTCMNTLCNLTCVRFAPSATFAGQAVFNYTITDIDGCTATAPVTITVLTPPVAVNDTASTCNGAPVLVNILANDSSDTPLQCRMITVTDPPHGTATVVNDPSCVNALCNGKCVLYTPDAGYTGADAFSYTIKDTDGCVATATVAINNCKTDAVNDQVTLCIGAFMDVNVLANDTTTCGSLVCPPVLGAIPPQITVTPMNCGGASCGSCVLRIQALTLPPGSPPFVVSFNYTICNNQSPPCCDTATVSVTLTPNPHLVDLPPMTHTPGDVTPMIFDVLEGADPGPGCTLNLASLEIISPLPSQGSIAVGPGPGQLTFTPFPEFVGSDRICYRIFNSCGCPDEACKEIQDTQPCPTANRMECGSLLLFPEFNNTAANLTLVTITDGCCGGTTQNVRIEIIFINKNNCLETNRTYTLTPCDTLSFVTSLIGPSNTQGFLYAFAKSAVPSTNNPNGTPIVYNHFIGQEMLINGITQFDYALNAVVFKGFGPEGANNDDDHDGVRDLNGSPDLALSEYEQAPDKILIPRFLGQDPAGAEGNSYQSDIVLVALSGGASFSTLLEILVYNDNEVQLSDQHEFRCWEKIPLRDFSSWTLESSLLTTNHNPNEIRDFDGNRKSGWILIDGATATSGAETINDPAFYAVLIERAGGRHAADLPFELCLQDNGDLIPHGLFGDGPNAHAGDNQ